MTLEQVNFLIQLCESSNITIPIRSAKESAAVAVGAYESLLEERKRLAA